MLIIDSFARFTGIGLLALVAALAMPELRTWRSAPYLTMACLSVIAFFVGHAPKALGLPDPLQSFARFLDIPHLIFVWLFALSLFEQNFELRPFHWLVGIVYCTPIFWIRLLGVEAVYSASPWVLHIVTIFSLTLMCHLVYSTLRGRADDLLERRRASRLYFILVIAFVAIIAAITDPLLVRQSIIDRSTIKILSIWPAIFWGSYWVLALDRNATDFIDRSIGTPVPDGRDIKLVQKLDMLMADQEVYKDSDLTIVALASQLGVSQHRLRSMINQTLGYQNFNEYLNGYRIAAVKKAFGDPQNLHLPILTIAMDCGFRSLSPFNRAFRNTVDMTPSKYRQSLDFE